MENVNSIFLHCIFMMESSISDPRWWLLVLSMFIPWILWWKLVDKSKFYEVFSFGLFWGLLATWLDLVGTVYQLWSYPFRLNQYIPTLLSADVAVIPVLYMLLYQYASTWKSYIIGVFLLALMFSYLFEPIFLSLNMLDFKKWSHLQSAISFFLLGISTKAIFVLVKKHLSVIS